MFTATKDAPPCIITAGSAALGRWCYTHSAPADSPANTCSGPTLADPWADGGPRRSRHGPSRRTLGGDSGMTTTTFEKPPAAMLAYRVNCEAYAIEARIAALHDFLAEPDSVCGSTGWALIQNHCNAARTFTDHLLNHYPSVLEYHLLDQDVAGLQSAIDHHNVGVALMLADRIQNNLSKET